MKIEKWNDVHGNTTPDDRMVAFLESSTDAYAVLQLKRIDETRDERFESLSALQRRGKEPDIEHYDVVYTGTLPPYTDQSAMLEGLYTKFNIDHPEDFRGHSISMSDIVALKVAHEVSFHYVGILNIQFLYFLLIGFERFCGAC